MIGFVDGWNEADTAPRQVRSGVKLVTGCGKLTAAQETSECKTGCGGDDVWRSIVVGLDMGEEVVEHVKCDGLLRLASLLAMVPLDASDKALNKWGLTLGEIET